MLRLRYPKTWKNIDNEDRYIYSSLGPINVTMKLSARNYRSAEELVLELNKSVKRTSIQLPRDNTEEANDEYAKYFTLWGQLSFEISESGHLRGRCFEGTSINVPSSKLRAILGLESSSLTVGRISEELQSGGEPHMVDIKEQFFRNPINVHAGDSAIFVYRCDIIIIIIIIFISSSSGVVMVTRPQRFVPRQCGFRPTPAFAGNRYNQERGKNGFWRVDHLRERPSRLYPAVYR